MPNSFVLLDVQSNRVLAELQLPLNQLELSFGQHLNTNPRGLVARLGPQLKKYIADHVHASSRNGKAWTVLVASLGLKKVEASPSGPYYELVANLSMIPEVGSSTRDFVMDYDVILHQVATHFALVSVRQDWEAGLFGEKPVELGVIDWDIRDNVIHPFTVSLTGGGEWNGFRQTVILGMHHIAEGTDHLLFLLVLLLPAPLLVRGKRWGTFGGARYSTARLLKIVSAFTIGHSITLIAGSLGWFLFPGQMVEVVIALSIIFSAIHALRPFFAGKELYIAAGFGLIHGMAFAGTLVNLNLDAYHLGLSILGFNVGIELMQLIVILCVFPWLMLLSRTSVYKLVRLTGATFSAIAASGWMLERITAVPNVITLNTERMLIYTPWFVGLLACGALASLWHSRHQVVIS